MTPLEFHRNLWNQKTRVSGLFFSGVVCVIQSFVLLVLIQHRLVTDGQTGSRTDIPR